MNEVRIEMRNITEESGRKNEDLREESDKDTDKRGADQAKSSNLAG
jgi:hypothetical protein